MALGSKLKSAMGWAGFVDDDRYVPAGTPTVTETTKPDATAAGSSERSDPVVPVVRPAPTPEPVVTFAGDNNQTVLLATGLLVAPASYQAIQPTCDRYRGGLVTLVNLRTMPLADAVRSLDFFQGMAYALQGRVKRLADKVFLLIPVGAQVDQGAVESAMAELS